MRAGLGELPNVGWIFADYGRDEEVTRYLTWRPHRTIDDAKRYLEAALAESADGARALRVLQHDGTSLRTRTGGGWCGGAEAIATYEGIDLDLALRF